MTGMGEKHVTLTLKEILCNPFQQEILGGDLDESSVANIEDSSARTSFRGSWYVRKTDAGYELVAGHHRLQAAKNLFGPNYEVTATCVDYTDQQMLVALIRDNDQSEDPRRNIDQIRAAHKFMSDSANAGECVTLREAKKTRVSGHRTTENLSRTPEGQHVHGSVRCVADFLGGKWEKSSVSHYFGLAGLTDRTLHPKIIAALAPATGSREGGHGLRIGEISQQVGSMFLQLDESAQEILFNAVIKADPPLSVKVMRGLISRASSDVRGAVEQARDLISKQASARAAVSAAQNAAKKRKKEEDKAARGRAKAEKKAQKERQRAKKLAEQAARKAEKEQAKARKAKERAARIDLGKEAKKKAKQEEREAQRKAKEAEKASREAERESRKREKEEERARKQADKEAEKARLKEERATRVFQRLTLGEAQLRFCRLLPFEAAEAAWKTAAKYLHPDRGGDGQLMAQLNGLWGVIKEKQYGR